MTDKIPEALAVLDFQVSELEYRRMPIQTVRLRNARDAFAGLIKAAATLNRESDYPIPAYFKKALAAVEVLP